MFESVTSIATVIAVGGIFLLMIIAGIIHAVGSQKKYKEKD